MKGKPISGALKQYFFGNKKGKADYKSGKTRKVVQIPYDSVQKAVMCHSYGISIFY